MRTIQEIQKDCWEKSIHALGTSYIFQNKAKRCKRRIRIITVLGLAVPLLIGGMVGTYGQNSLIVTIAFALTAPVALVQLIFSLISLIYKWDDILSYSLESQTENRSISDAYQQLAKYPPNNLTELHNEFEIIRTKDDARKNQDDKINFTNKENRKGLRYALWIMQRTCVTCTKIPNSMSPSKCSTCGNF